MINEVLVSVIIPTYNREKTIADAILSVTAQPVENMEILVVDDGSTDQTEQVVHKLSVHDPRIKYVRQQNSGANRARNLGVRLARGKYIAFNDSDDVWRKGKLEKEMACLGKDKGLKGVFSKFKLHYINESKEMVAPEQVKNPLYLQMLEANVINTPNFIIERNVIQEFGGFNEELRRFQDWELAARIAKKYPLFFLNEILVDTYQYGSGHLSNNKTSGIESYKHLEEEFAQDRDQYPAVKGNFYFNMVTFMYGTEAFWPNLFRSIKCCRFNLKLILKLIKFLLKKK